MFPRCPERIEKRSSRGKKQSGPILSRSKRWRTVGRTSAPRSLSHSVMSLNATSASSSIFHRLSAQELYAGTDFTSLSWFERQWANWYLLIGDPVIATGLASFLLHEVCTRLTFPVRPL